MHNAILSGIFSKKVKWKWAVTGVVDCDKVPLKIFVFILTSSRSRCNGYDEFKYLRLFIWPVGIGSVNDYYYWLTILNLGRK